MIHQGSVYKIRNAADLYANHGYGWSARGRVFASLAALKLHLRNLPAWKRHYEGCEVVEFKFTEVGAVPVESVGK